MKKIIIAIVVILLIILGVYLLVSTSSNKVTVDGDDVTSGLATTTTQTENKDLTVIGNSVMGKPINAYHFGTGADEVIFVGGIHGGYAWNTSVLAYNVIDALKSGAITVPANEKVTIIPVLNPDGLAQVTSLTGSFTSADVSLVDSKLTAGRFNGNNVDLNRNFDCDWQANAKWQSKNVSGGTAAFSEPEALAIKNYIEKVNPKAVIVWYSAANGVFAANCHAGILPVTKSLVQAISKASGYPAHEEFNFYETTGDMTNWLAKIGVPSASILLTDHTNIDWAKNKPAVESVIKYFAK